MSRFTKIAPVAVMAALAATATPALAAPDGHSSHRDGFERHGYNGNVSGRHYTGFGEAAQIRREIGRLDARIDNALARRDISPREAMSLRRDVRELHRLYNRFAIGGMSRWEAQTLETRLADAQRALRFERRDHDRRRG